MNRRGRVVVGVLLLAALGVVLWRRGESSEKARSGSHVPAQSERAGSASAKTSESSASGFPAGFVNPRAKERRIAGRVMFDGKPFAGATVTLSAWGGLIIPDDNQRTSAADGTFDLGVRPGATFNVVASAPGKVDAIAYVHLGDPTSVPKPEALELVLGTCEAWIAGAVRDASGGPIVHAHVRRSQIAGVDTDERGAYELCVPPGDTTLAVSADGYGAVSLSFPVQLHTRRDVVLIPEAVVQGIVVDEKGKPVPDAYVSVTPAQWGRERAMERSGKTGADGRFRIDELLPGRVRIWAFADGLSTESGPEVVAAVGVAQDVIVTLVARGEISGTVMRDRKPVAGVRIRAVRKSPAGSSWDTASQEDGSFVLRLVPPGELILSTESDKVVAPTSIHLDARPLTGVIVELETLATIKGHVTRNGKPVARATVCCAHSDGQPQTRTDADGAYSFEGVAPGAYVLTANNEHAFADAKKVTVTGAENQIVDLELNNGAEIRGTVVDEAGTPVPGVWVKFQHPTTGDLCRTTSDERGQFECGAMTGGAKYVGAVYATSQLDSPLPTPSDKPYPSIDLKDGASVVEGVRLTVLHHHGQIKGRVVDTKGNALPDARVQANNAEQFSSWLSLETSVTDVDGNFVLDDLAEGSYFLQARSTDGGTGSAKTAVGAAPIVIAISLPGSVEGALAGFQAIPAIYAAPTGITNELSPGTVEGARYHIGGLQPGHYVVSAQTTYEGDVHEVEIKSGETTHLDLTAKGRGSIDAVITDRVTGAGVADVVCHVVIAVNGRQGVTNWDPATAPHSDADGRLHFEPAPAGDVIVSCLAMNGARSAPSVELVLAPNATASVAMQSVASTQATWGTTGIQFDWRTPSPRIAMVDPKSGAADAGLAAGDLVVAVDDKQVGALDDQGVLFLINDHPIGAKIPITVVRGGQKVRVIVEMRGGN
ncbi:MAG TPA: carboxypeptidase-like regulatory domain-containing protein [Kofleriaceae bacterium]